MISFASLALCILPLAVCDAAKDSDDAKYEGSDIDAVSEDEVRSARLSLAID